MSMFTKTAAILLVINGIFFSVANAEIKPTGRRTASTTQVKLAPVKQTISRVSNVSTSTLSKATVTGFNVGVGTISYGNSSVILGSLPSSIDMEPGTSQTIEVSMSKNGYSGNLYFASVYETDFSDPASVAAQQHISAAVTSSSAANANGSPYTIPVVQVQISVAATAAPGTGANFKLMGHNVPGNQVIAPRFFTVNVIPSTTAADYIDCFFAPYDGTDPMYTSGWASINSAFAVYDANGNGVLDTAGGSNNTAFPAFPTATGGATMGRAYASPAGDQANIIVSGVFNDTQMFALHLKATNTGELYPVMALVGDLSTGEIMIQDVDGWVFNIDGTLPSNGQPGSIGGTITFTPFYFDGFANQILGNTVSLYFDMALQPDA